MRRAKSTTTEMRYGKGKPVTLWLPVALLNELDRRANETSVTRSSMAVDLLATVFEEKAK